MLYIFNKQKLKILHHGNKQHSEDFDYIQEMKKCLETVDEYLVMRKDIESKD